MSAPGPAERAATSRPLATASFVIGIVSIFMQWTFVVPVAGILLGVAAKRRSLDREPMASWGIALNTMMLVAGIALWILGGALILAALGLHV